ncbi:MAG TPA: hypothetical protein VI977_06185 [archaeon]|nr:hypothetical protein [archaeon]
MRRILKKLSRKKRAARPHERRILPSGFRIAFDFVLESSNFVISGDAKTVYFPRAYKNVFRRGEKILAIHMDSKYKKPGTPREALGLLKQFVLSFSGLKRQGYAGCAGDTPNSALVKFFRKQGAVIAEAPWLAHTLTRQAYRMNAKEFGYPEKYATKPVQRIVMRFQ